MLPRNQRAKMALSIPVDAQLLWIILQLIIDFTITQVRKDVCANKCHQVVNFFNQRILGYYACFITEDCLAQKNLSSSNLVNLSVL